MSTWSHSTICCLLLFQDFVPVSSDPSCFVQRLLDAGAIAIVIVIVIVIGKTSTPEGGLGSHTCLQSTGTNVQYNAYDLSKSAAGASSGNAAVTVGWRRAC
jgi:Asp-tRNA(Asn)/Glu-tRNA(Gln) amidotransferase A subunit family amidase